MSRKKIQTQKTLGQRTEDRLMKYILDNNIEIGEKIQNEFELAQIFGVGRSTIREAVKGLVSRDLFDVRLMIEPEIAALACANATASQIAELKVLCDEVEMLYTQGHDHIQKDVEFHSYIAKLSGNMVVERLIPVINTSVVVFANITYRRLMNETIETHRAIVNCIESHDAVGAKCAMNMHLTYNRQAIMELIKERNDRNVRKKNTSDV